MMSAGRQRRPIRFKISLFAEDKEMKESRIKPENKRNDGQNIVLGLSHVIDVAYCSAEAVNVSTFCTLSSLHFVHYHLYIFDIIVSVFLHYRLDVFHIIVAAFSVIVSMLSSLHFLCNRLFSTLSPQYRLCFLHYCLNVFSIIVSTFFYIIVSKFSTLSSQRLPRYRLYVFYVISTFSTLLSVIVYNLTLSMFYIYVVYSFASSIILSLSFIIVHVFVLLSWLSSINYRSCVLCMHLQFLHYRLYDFADVFYISVFTFSINAFALHFLCCLCFLHYHHKVFYNII